MSALKSLNRQFAGCIHSFFYTRSWHRCFIISYLYVRDNNRTNTGLQRTAGITGVRFDTVIVKQYFWFYFRRPTSIGRIFSTNETTIFDLKYQSAARRVTVSADGFFFFFVISERAAYAPAAYGEQRRKYKRTLR